MGSDGVHELRDQARERDELSSGFDWADLLVPLR